MKTFKIFSMAALAITMAACSNSDDNDIVKTAPAEAAATIHFSATLPALSSGATTRTTYTESGDQINVAWAVGDKIALLDGDTNLGTATVKAVNSTGSATIEASLTSSVSDGQSIKLRYPANADTDDLQGQDGTLDYIQNNLDIREASATLSVSGEEATLKESVELVSTIAIWKLTFTNGSRNIMPTMVTVKVGDTKVAAAIGSSGMSACYLCLIPDKMGSGDLTIEAGPDTYYTYVYTKTGGVTLTAGNYYQSTVTMDPTINLSKLTGDYEANEGDILTGTLSDKYKISIADGATVTLDGATITPEHSALTEWAGLTCTGDATIILKGTNTVQSFNDNYPGIFIASGKTLTIQGDGSLTASGKDKGAGIGGAYDKAACGNIVIEGGTITATGGEGAAGIGGGYNWKCGNITISGGTVNATGGKYAPGIGSGQKSSCGDITISGGTVEATGGENAPGIGSAYNNGTCGTITITNGVTKVTATKGSSSDYSINNGDSKISIGGSDSENITTSPYTYQPTT